MSFFIRNIILILTLFSTNYAFGLNSSSYLVANTAINLFDFDKAKGEFDEIDLNFSESDLHNQLLTYVNLKLLLKANTVAKKIIEINEFNQEAWIVLFTYSFINEDLSIINKFNKDKNLNKMDLLKFIFFTKNNELKKSDFVAKSILEVIQASAYNSQNNINYKFTLFYLSIALILDPDLNETNFYLAQIYEKLEKYTTAEFFYKKIPINHKLFINSQTKIAINKNKAGYEDNAIKILINLLDHNKKNFDLIISLADLYRVQKKYKEAIQHYNQIISFKEKSYNELWRIYYLRGICYERLGNWKSAEKNFLLSLKIKSDSPQVLNYLAYGWIERDLYLDKAVNMLEEAYQSSPNSYYIADSLAWAFYKKNRLYEAADLMEKVIELAPGEAVSLFHLADIYYAMDRKREAYFYWKQALDLAQPEDKIKEKLIEKLEFYNEG